jgi:predicted Ser/Thr protein kinase
MTHQEDKSIISKVFDQSSESFSIESISKISKGNNNRTYLAQGHGRKVIAKFYFSSDSDNRDRLDHEYKFLKYAEKININCVPKPIIKSKKYNLGIYEHIDARPFQMSDLGKNYVIEAADFFSSLNPAGQSSQYQDLKYASEAFLDPQIYVNNIDKRIAGLVDVLKNKNADSKTNFFIKNLQEAWAKIKSSLIQNENLIKQHHSLCVSPSDFGFHNALIKKDKIFFIDFEYAGIDDAAKVICDFFIQPEIKVPMIYLEEFANRAFPSFNNKDLLLERAIKLLPLFQIKWCCIMMNEFMPNIAERRLFSDPDLDLEASKFYQLEKASSLLIEINY